MLVESLRLSWKDEQGVFCCVKLTYKFYFTSLFSVYPSSCRLIVYLDIITFMRVSVITVWGTGQVFIITESSLFRSARYLEYL